MPPAPTPLSLLSPEQLKDRRDEVLAYIDLEYEPLTWQKVTTSGPCATPTWNDGVWLAWDNRGNLVGVIGASDGWYPSTCVYPHTVDLELSRGQVNRLARATTYKDRRVIAP